MSDKQKQQGFTVLELLVALALFSLLGLGAHMLLGSAQKNSMDAKARSAELLELQKIVQIMERDITQAKPSSIHIGESGSSISFSRKEAGNDIDISYILKNNSLTRNYAGIPQNLSNDINAMKVQKLLPNLLNIELNSSSLGQINRLLEVPDE